MSKIGFIFIGYNQTDELHYTLHNLRGHSQLADSPVSVVLSGDPDFIDPNASVVEHVPNIVQHSVDDLVKHLKDEDKLKRPGIGFNHYNEPASHWAGECASCSMLRNYSVGAKNLHKLVGKDLDYVVVTESNILLLNWESIERVANQIGEKSAVGAFETVTGYADASIPWGGADLFPQLFIMDWRFCVGTSFLFDMVNTRPDVMEITLRENLDRCLADAGKSFSHDILNFGNRGQWGIHTKPDFVWFAHLDRPVGADAYPEVRWASREKQLNYERRLLPYFGQCLGDCRG